MKIYYDPPAAELDRILERPADDHSEIREVVSSILQDVAQEGDAALARLTSRFDRWKPGSFAVPVDDIQQSEQFVSEELKSAILLARRNIETFHAAQREEIKTVETAPGISCWRKSVPIQRVGLYIPGGTAPLISTLLMLGIPAKLAGCPEIVVCTPAMDGHVHPAILYCASIIGIDRIYKVGGAQAIAAMAYGTESIPAVYKIFGPGNRFVTLAKQMVSSIVPIDMPAGPSEVAVYADDTANPAFVASDLLSQAEHGKDSQVLLVSVSSDMVQAVIREVEIQKQQLPRRAEIDASLQNSRCIIMPDVTSCFDVLNRYAAEHLILATDEATGLSELVINAGSVFIGHFSPESAGDYVSGTNHTLPTGGFAKSHSGVSLDSFFKKITFQKLSRDGLLGVCEAISRLADAEGLAAHKQAVLKRFESNPNE